MDRKVTIAWCVTGVLAIIVLISLFLFKESYRNYDLETDTREPDGRVRKLDRQGMRDLDHVYGMDSGYIR